MAQEISELIAALAPHATRTSYERGTTLFRSDDPVSGIFIVREGSVRMFIESPADIVVPPRILGPGEIAGLPATLTGTYSLSAETAEDTELDFIAARHVTELLECSPRLCMVVMSLISEEIARMRSALRHVPALHSD